MSKDLKKLDKQFRKRIKKVLDAYKPEGIIMKPYCTIRTPIEQAKLWRQSRSKQEIDKVIKIFESAKCYYLAYCIEKAGPQYGVKVTNALPGFSWHP
jgi:hypothetical protein